ncbi:protein-export membrane protein SecD [Knoellia sinensis KCTC 19936]|uniref:Protein translocase subunit SecD n=1 Tax=Knoellia sinensis KCTC 19936 TaxID=1385520 RepID=A0A0A0J7F6_9MICO|nr:protein translocase subunit SecD [Knoellia sinensis]KGN33330.1 protein-export membrane protein SecD [Knoellia sinensis KCTC 19936]
MAQMSHAKFARRALAAMTVLTLALMGLLFGANQFSNGSYAPKLGLDLEGGTQLILEPRVAGGRTVAPEQVTEARDIIVQRVDAGGFSGAEVTTQGGRNIVVSMPGDPTQRDEDALRRSSQMQFRPVLAIAAGTPAPAPSASPSGSPAPSGSATPSPAPSASAPAASPVPSTTNKSAIPGAFTTEPSPSAPSGSPSPSASPSPSPSASGSGAAASDPYSLDQITPELTEQFTLLDCSKDDALENLVDDENKAIVTCDQDGAAKYILGPVVVSGDKISDAVAGYQVGPQGQQTATVEIQLSLNGEGTEQYADVSRKMVALQAPQNQLAATLDSRVIVAPSFNEAIPNGKASITGGFGITEARDLAQQLKFGALPISFDLQTREQISPTLGSEQLRYGLYAGIVGLLLVVLYSLAQYRVLGFVTIASIVAAGLLTYLAITILGWSHNYRLDMAGVTGLIVAIGFTADSFIVYFERIRDELREGRSLESAVATGWDRAKRTILIADGVNFLAAIVLFFLASSSVRGFAFTLGLTTLLDILIVFAFTHPLVTLLARRKFFRDGHPMSGLDPDKLGAVKKTSYAGRGRFTTTPPRVAGGEGSAS